MKVLILAPYPLYKAPSQRFRFEHFSKFMKDAEINCNFHSFISSKDWNNLYSKGKSIDKMLFMLKGFWSRVSILFDIKKYSYVLIHRELTPFAPPIFEWIIAKVFKKKIIYDFDDAIWLADPNGENWIWKALKWRSKVSAICKWSWKVSAGNEYLADFARQYCSQVEIFPTIVDTGVHSPNAQAHKHPITQSPIIGWTGSHSTLFYLNELLPVLLELENDTEFEFLVIANKNPELPLKGFRFLPWNKETEIEDLSQIDIGVMPLEDNEWAKGKCGFKLIQYLSLEIPAVASPVGVNDQIVLDGKTGYLASSPSEWKEKLLSLIEDCELRKQIGIEGRKLIEEKYSVKSQQENFLNLFR
ncbi:MAG: glycosyltransferase [Cyclobacteriaceae bacterium]